MEVEPRRRLRAALAQADGAAALEAIRAMELERHMQFAGDGLLTALCQGVDGAAELSEQCAAGLRARNWEGDDELAAELDRARGAGMAAALAELPVDLEELSDPLEEGLGALEVAWRVTA